VPTSVWAVAIYQFLNLGPEMMHHPLSKRCVQWLDHELGECWPDGFNDVAPLGGTTSILLPEDCSKARSRRT
jgi:hypothetical protein